MYHLGVIVKQLELRLHAELEREDYNDSTQLI